MSHTLLNSISVARFAGLTSESDVRTPGLTSLCQNFKTAAFPGSRRYASKTDYLTIHRVLTQALTPGATNIPLAFADSFGLPPGGEPGGAVFLR